MDRSIHILVVDDDGEVRDVIAMMLEDRGYRVSSAANGAAMRDLLKADHGIDAVVLDCVLPGEPSLTVVDHLKELGLPVALISGSPKAIRDAAEHGLPLLQKPFRAPELCDSLAKALLNAKGGPP